MKDMGLPPELVDWTRSPNQIVSAGYAADCASVRKEFVHWTCYE